MINYFLGQDPTATSFKTKTIIKQKLIKKKKYQPFHLDCQYTKKKICYCKVNPVCKMSDYQKSELWKTYEGAATFYEKHSKPDLQKAEKQYDKCVEKIRHLDKSEVIRFLEKIKIAKRMDFTNESYQQTTDGMYH